MKRSTQTTISVLSRIITNLGEQQSSRVAKDLAGAAAAHAKKTLTIRIVLVTADRLQLAAFHFNQHSAKRRVAIHGTHGPDDSRIASGHVHLRPRHRARVILSDMDSTATSHGRFEGVPRSQLATSAATAEMGH